MHTHLKLVPARRLLLLTVVFACGLAGGVPAAQAAAGPLTVSPITWNVVGLDSNSAGSGPNTYQVGSRVCNTGSSTATNAAATWYWGASGVTSGAINANSFNGPAESTAITVGSIAGNACQDVYFSAVVHPAHGAINNNADYWVQATADGALSANQATRNLYIQSLISQNRNHVQKLSGPGGCNLTYTVCDSPATNLYVGHTYTYKLYTQTATAYDQVTSFINWPSFAQVQSASATFGTHTSAGLATSNSIWSDGCSWVPGTSTTPNGGGACGASGKAGGRVITTYTVKPTTTGTSTGMGAIIYDHSGGSFHYNGGDFSTNLVSSFNANWELLTTISGNGAVTSSPAGTTPAGASSGINCGTTTTTCNVGYATGTSVTLTETPGSGQTFTGWSGGGCSGTSSTCTVTMSQERDVTASFTGLTSYPLTVTTYGSGSVGADSGTVSCGSTCVGNYTNGTNVTLTATASAGWSFAGWSGGGCSGTSPTCVVTMSQAQSTTATFIQSTYTLTVSALSANGTGIGDICSNTSNQTSGTGACTPGTTDPIFISCGSSTDVTTNFADAQCSGTYPSGTAASLYAFCQGGSSTTVCPGGSGASKVTFGGFSGGTCSGTSSSCSFTMDQNRTVSGTFDGTTSAADLTISKVHTGDFSQGQTGKTYTITASNVGNASTSGTVSVADSLPSGLTATALSGTGWTCTLGTLTCTRTDALSAGSSYPGITLTVSVALAAGTPLTNNATVSGGGESNTTNDTASDSTNILTPADLVITGAHNGSWDQGSSGNQYFLTATNTGGQATSGTVSVADTLPSGWTASAISGSGWTCTLATVSCTRSDALAAGSSYPEIVVTASVPATAVAASNTATVSGGGETVTSNDSATDPTTVLAFLSTATAGNGSGTVTDDQSQISCGSTCSAFYTEGTSVTLTEAPSAGSTFTGWSGGCSGTATTCTVSLSQTRSVTATFTLQQFTLTASNTGSGTGTVTSDSGGINCGSTCAASYNSGTQVVLTAAPDSGSTFAGWSGGGCSGTSSTCTVTMSADQSVSADFVSGATAILSIAKSHTGNFTQGDAGKTYALAVSNTGGAASSGTVTVIDTLPSGLTATSISGTGWTCDLPSLTCTRSNSLGAGSSYPDITVTVSVAAGAASSVTNTASVSGGGCAGSPCNTASDPTTINPVADLTITKSHQDPFKQGDSGDPYTITVTNSGAGPTTGTVTATDSLPSGLTATAISGTGWSCTLGTLICTRSGALAAGSSYPAITVTVDVASSASSSVTNSATVSGGGELNTTNDAISDPTTITQAADLTISKSHAGSFTQGDTGDTYTLTVSNSGPGPTSGTVTATDTLPSGLTATAISGTGWSCTVGTLTCIRSDALTSGSSYPAVTVTVDVASSASSSVTNSASVSGGGELNTSNDSASDPTTIIQLADLTIAKTHTGNFSQGDTGDTYALTVSNSGPGPTSGTVTATDSLPSGLTATAISGTGWSCTLGTLTCTRSDALASGSSYPAVTVTVTVAGNASSSVTNSATVSGGGELNTTNDSASDPTTIVQLADLTIAKSHSGNFTQGDTGDAYTLAVSNAGPGPTSGTVTATDTLPSGLTATAISGTGWSCTLGTLTCTRSDALASGSSYPSITVTVNVASGASSSVTNSAAVSGGGELNTANDSTTDPTTITQVADLTIAKSHVGNFTQGDTGDTYTLTVANAGPGPTSGTVAATDSLPSGLTATAISGTGWSCTLGTLTCSRSDVLASGSSYPAITVTVDVASGAASSVANSASVSGGGELNTSNDSTTDPTTITQLAGLAISKSHTGNFTQGDTGDTYTLTVSNGGPGATSGTVTATDSLPGGLTATAISGTGWSCTLGTLTCTRADALAASSSYPAITVTVNVAATASSSVTNSATVSGGGCLASPCDSASDPTTINQVADLTVSKSHAGNFTQGDTARTYTLTVSNGGPGPTSGTVTATDTLPSGLTATAISGTGWNCTLGTLTCTRSDVLASGSSYPAITVTVDVASGASSSVTNSASVSGGGELNTSNDSTTDPTTIVQVADLSISKSHTGNFTQGDTARTYTLTVSNGGPGPTSGTVTATDTLPSGLTATAISGTGWSCTLGTLTCTRSDVLASGSSYPAITVTVNVSAGAASSVTNAASVSGGGELNTSNDSASDPTTITQVADLTIAKSHAGNFSQGDTGKTYTLTVSNGGPGPTSGTVTATDSLPSGLTSSAISGTGWSCTLATLTCNRSDVLASGASYPAITVTVDVASNSSSSVTNSASVSGGGELNTTNDSTTDPTTVTQLAGLAISKSHTGNFTQGDTGDTYRLTVSNGGPGSTSGTVTATDSLPSGLTATAISGTGWSCTLGTLTCTRSDVLASGSSYPAITVTVNVAGSASSSVTNSATVSGGGCLASPCDSASDPTTITQVADLTVSKSHTGNFTQGDTGKTYVLTVTNAGPGPTGGTVTATDSLPSGLTATAISGTGWSCTLGTLTCTRSDVLGSGPSYPAITVTVDVASGAASSVTNSASVSGGGELNTTNDSASDPTTITQVADLTIAKSHPGNFSQGDTGETYTLTVSNGGPGPTSGTVTATDTLPSGLSATAILGTGWSCTLGTLTCTRSDVLASGSSYPAITVTVNVAGNASSPITNSASVSGGGELDTSNDAASDPTTVIARYALSVSRAGSGSGSVSSSPSGVNCGSTCGATYDDGTLVTLTATADSTSTFIGWSDPGCSGTGTCTVAMTQARSVTATFGTAALSIAKSHTGNFSQGDTGKTYTLTVSNGGSGATSGTVTATDSLPSGLTATAISGTGWSCTLGTLTCTRSDALASGSSYPAITLTVSVASNAPSSVTNSATVSGGGCSASPCNSANDPTTIVQLADLTIAKSHTGNFTQGDTGKRYTLTVSNGGPGPTSGTVTATDLVPSGLTATAISGTGWSCTLGTLACSRSDALASGSSYPAITVTVSVASNAASSVTNWAAVSGGGELDTSNDTASDPTTITQVADLTIAKSHTGNFSQGDTGKTYTLTVSNGGSGATSGTVTATDSLPSGLTATAISGTGWSCTLGTLTCTRSDALASGSSYPAITVTVNVSTGASSSVTNSASASGGGELNTSNDTASDPTTITQVADLTISKSHTGNFTQGDTGKTYTLTVSNGGPGPTSGTVSTTDSLPSGLTATAISGTGWSCTLGTLTCNRSDVLASGASYPAITVTVDVASTASSSVTNSATVSGGGELDTTNDSTTDPTTITQVAGLSISKTHAGNFKQGDSGDTYTITVGNHGSGPTAGTVTVADSLPTGLTATAISGTGWSCTLATLTCTRSDALAAGSSYPAITVTVNVANDASSSVTNSASVSGGGCLASPSSCDSTTDPTTITQVADLSISKTHSGNFTQGDSGDTYALTVKNVGPGPTVGAVTVTDSLPTGLTATGISGTGWSCTLTTLTCTRSDALASGSSYPAVTVTVDVANDAGGSVTNSARVSGGGELNTANDSTTDPTTIGARYALTITKSGGGSGWVGADVAGINCGSQCNDIYGDGTKITLTAKPDAGSTFSGWSGSGCSGTGACVVAMSQARSVTAAFDVASAPAQDKPGTLSGTVYNDRNLSSVQDQGEPGLAGWTVYVDYNGNGTPDSGDPSAVTGSDGSYKISNVTPGTYVVREVGQTGWTCSDPSPCQSSTIFKAAAQVTGKDFGNWAHAAVTGVKFEDANRNGVHNPGEAPLGGWTIYVDYNGNGKPDPGEPSSVTLPNGHYGISAVAAGSYPVREVAQDNWHCSLPKPCSYPVQFKPDTLETGKDFGNWSPARISGNVWNDLNADAFHESAEPGLAGWVVYVDYKNSGHLDPTDTSTITDANGNYSLGVDLGTYTVREVPPARWICSFPQQGCGHKLTFTSGSNLNGIDFGNYKLARLTGVEFNDYNRNRTQDQGDPGLGGWVVYVDYNNNGTLDPGEPSDTSYSGGALARDAAASGQAHARNAAASGRPNEPAGYYGVTGIEPGNWTIREKPELGFPCTYPTACSYHQAFQSNSSIVGKNFATFRPPPQGSAQLRAASGCVSKAFIARVAGREIRAVSFSVDRGHSKKVRQAGASTRYAIRILPTGMSPGVHHLFVTVYFQRASRTSPKRLIRAFYRCPSTQPPEFTG